MQIIVRFISGKQYTIEVSNGDTIQDLKEKIRTASGVTVHGLVYGGKSIDAGGGDKTLGSHNVLSGGIVVAVEKTAAANLGPKFKIYVKVLDGKTYVVEVSELETVDSLKKQLNVKAGMEPSHMRLVFGGANLDAGGPDKTMKDFGIHADCNVMLIERLPGGSC